MVMIDIDLARQILDSDGFFRNHTVEVMHIRHGDVSISVPMKDNVERLGGMMSGAAIMAFSDAAGAFCALTLEDVMNEVSSSLSTNFYTPIRKGPVSFNAKLRKGGRTLAYCHVEVRDGDGKLCAESSGTYYLYRQ